MPATTIVLEWSSAETGVGPSIVEGSHGCKPNWADFSSCSQYKACQRQVGVIWVQHEDLLKISGVEIS